MSVLTCAKCGGTDIWTSYHKDEWSGDGCGYGTFNKRHGEHLHYGCRTCRWDWTGKIVKEVVAREEWSGAEGREDG